MYVKIGPHPNWIGPYQIVDKLFFWHEKYPNEELEKRWDYKLHSLAQEWLAKTWVADFCQWYQDRFKQRKIVVKLDYYDHWNCDSTLTPIILPLLKQLKEKKQGSGYVDLEDVPEELRATFTEDYDAQSTFDFYTDPELNKQNIKCDVHARYEWVLNEMIWAFEQLNADDWENQYWKTKPEFDLDKYPEDEGKTIIPVRWKVKGECDWVGRQKHQDRISNGLRLFGKYFETLWD